MIFGLAIWQWIAITGSIVFYGVLYFHIKKIVDYGFYARKIHIENQSRELRHLLSPHESDHLMRQILNK